MNISKIIKYVIGILLVLVVMFLVYKYFVDNNGKTGKESESKSYIVKEGEVKNLVYLDGQVVSEKEQSVYSDFEWADSGKVTSVGVDEGTSVDADTVIANVEVIDQWENTRTETINSPIAGVVTQLDIEIDQRVSEGISVAVVTDLDELILEGEITEYDLLQIEKKDSVTIEFDAIEGKTYKGSIKKMFEYPTVEDSEKYRILIEIEKKPEKLMLGMSASIEITTDFKEDVIVVEDTYLTEAKGAYYVSKVETKDREDVVSKQKVVIGLRGETYVEVISGLKVGDEITIPGETKASDEKVEKKSESINLKKTIGRGK